MTDITPPDPVWVQRFELVGQPDGPLAGLSFAVKDLIAVGGLVCSSGNPHWGALRKPEPHHAAVVAQCIGAGARCAGTVWCDEFAFGLSGENPWGGTPENPKAAGCLPGGSSSGSAVAVAKGDVDFALGTDTGGSIRVPASWCGLWGWRPSHGLISLQGVAPLAPSLDVVGVFCRDPASLARIAQVLDPIAAPGPSNRFSPPGDGSVTQLIWIPELWSLADPPVQTKLHKAAQSMGARLNAPLVEKPLAAFGLSNCSELLQTFQAIQWHEIAQSLAKLPATLPKGPILTNNLERVANRDRSLYPQALSTRAHLQAACTNQLEQALLLLPVTPGSAPALGSLNHDRRTSTVLQSMVCLNAIAALGGLPELSIPIGASNAAPPIGLGVLAGAGQDHWLIQHNQDAIAP